MPTTTTLPKSKPEKLRAGRRKRVALYARVSTQEQTKGQFPSCGSQIEELQVFAASRNWEIIEEVKDEGHRAGTLQRPGLTFLRHLVSSQQVDIVACTWYNRLIGSRDFYVLDKEFKANDVDFVTLHDPADRNTASGRLLESMLVTIKTFENEQIAEKVQTKMRQRAEKGLWNGGLVPFSFSRDFEHKTIVPDLEKAPILEQMFRVYLDTQSDFKVRDWLKARNIPTSTGKPVWAVSTVRDVLMNRLYIGEIEINRRNKGLIDLSENQAYRIAKAPFEPLVPLDVFEAVQALRQQKAHASPNRVGRPRSYSQTQCGRVYLLQGIMSCGCCGHSMTPWYVHHKAGKHRRKDSFVNYYVCAKQMKNWKASDHKNLVLARVAESWMLDRIQDFVESPETVERVFEKVRQHNWDDLKPLREALGLTQIALRENQAEVEKMFAMMNAGQANDALFRMLNERAGQLQSERERLHLEERELSEKLVPLSIEFNAEAFCRQMVGFSELIKEARPEELQRLLRLLVRHVKWMPNGEHIVEYYCFAPDAKLAAKTKNQPQNRENTTQDWLYTDKRLGCPERQSLESVHH